MKWHRHANPRAGSGRLVVGLVLVGAVIAVVVAFKVMQNDKPADPKKKAGDPIAKAKEPPPVKEKEKEKEPVKEPVKDKEKEPVKDKEKEPVKDKEKEPDPAKDHEKLLAAGKQLFDHNCAQCHGDKGDGNGAAARYLHPKPRNFGEGNFRIVTTVNGKPSDKDLHLVISRGMPGSMMIPFGHLSEADRNSLVAYVRQLTLTGFVEKRKKDLLDQGEEVDVAEITKSAQAILRPGPDLEVPKEFPPSNPASLAKGREMYLKVCASCHGDQGKGDGSQEQKNTDGTPTKPRDLTLGLFKGTREPAQLFARFWKGMPGSPMPSAAEAFQADEIGHLINYINSFSEPALSAKVEHKRTQLVAKKVGTLGETISEDVWGTAPATALAVSPLWWRVHALPELKVAAVHDGNTLAVRFTWKDASKNESVARPEDFEDMAAMQLYKGDKEPFLGMGAEGANLDLWLWRAGWQRQNLVAQEQPNLLDDYPFDMPIYTKVLNGNGKAKGVPDFLTARAAGNQHAHADAKPSASSLTAKGFGSTTFRPKASQLVTAQSSYKDGTWTVVLRRALKVGADDGLTVAPGDRVSTAFALWDGQARDRNGQKMVSIWHDLKIE